MNSVSRWSVCALFALLAVGLMSKESFGVLIASDDFESYTDGAGINAGAGGTGWTGNWFGVAGATTELGVIPSYGTSLQFATAADNAVGRNFTAQTGDELFIGFVLRTPATWTTSDFIQIISNNTTAATSSFGSGQSGGVQNLASSPYFVRKGAAANTTNTPTLGHPDDTTQQIVLRFSKSVSGAANNYDVVELFLNQATQGTADLTRGSAASGDGLVSTMSAFHVRTFNAAIPEAFIDNVNVATTYVQAVPEPGTLAIAGFGGCLAVAGVVRKRMRRPAGGSVN